MTHGPTSPPQAEAPAPAAFPAEVTAAPAAPEQAFCAEVREIMGRTPNWLIRRGMMAIGTVVLVLLLLSWLIRYPDIIKAKITVTGLNPPVGVVARQNGHLEKLFVTESQRVQKGDLLALIKSPADSDRVFALVEELQKLEPFFLKDEDFKTLELGAEASLGRLQGSYSAFHSNYLRYANTIAEDYISVTITTLNAQLERKKAQVVNMEHEAEASLKELELARQKYERMVTLHGRESISLAVLQEQESAYLAKQRQNAEVQKSFLGEQIAAANYEKEIRDLEYERRETLRKEGDALRQSLKKLLSDIEIWENDYVLRAPTDGIVAFYEFWSDQQYVASGKEVFIIVPEKSPLLGRIPVTQGGVGKVKVGQKVRIRFNEYPYKQFGSVTGRVQSVSLVPRQGANLVSVELESPLVTSYGKLLPPKQEMTGEAGIVTEDIRLIGRIFYEFRKAFLHAFSRGAG